MARFARFRGAGRRSGRPARGVDWGGFSASATLSAGSQDSWWVLSPQDVRAGYVDPTLMFSRLHIAGRTSTSAPGGGVETRLAVGLITMRGDTDTALPVVGDHPDPGQDPDAEWIIHQVIIVPPGAASQSLLPLFGDRQVHSRAMRRLGNDQGLLLIVDGEGVDWDYTVYLRYLLKE